VTRAFWLILWLLLWLAPALLAQPYYPGRHLDWKRKTPAEAGFDAAALDAAITFAQRSESKNPRDLKLNHDLTFGRETYGEALGPFEPRGEMTGVIVRGGYLVTE